jgi:hypothetical protein
MSDGHTHAINQCLDEREDWDTLQEVTAELEQAEARIEELEAKLAKAVLSVKRLSTSECFGSSEVWGLSLSDSPLGREILARMDYANTTLAELKGETE